MDRRMVLRGAPAGVGAASGGRARPRHRADPAPGRLALYLLAPAFVLLGLVVALPALCVAVDSLRDLRLAQGGWGRFVGLENYRIVLSDPFVWKALRNTLVFTAVTVPGALAVGGALALLASLPFRRRRFVRLALLVPWAIPPAFAGLIAAWFLDGRAGPANAVLALLRHAPHAWLGNGKVALLAICLVIIWRNAAFVALVLLAGLQSVPVAALEAASVDGADAVRRFLHVTLPLLRPAIAVAAIFSTISALQAFDIPFAMTRGGPWRATTTLAMMVQRNNVVFRDLGIGSVLAVLLGVLGAGVTALWLRHLRALDA